MLKKMLKMIMTIINEHIMVFCFALHGTLSGEKGLKRLWKFWLINGSLLSTCSSKFNICDMYLYGLLTKCEVKMAGYWSSSFFAYLWTETKSTEVHKLAKKERGQYPAILAQQTWSIKDLLYGFRGNFSCGIQRVVPSGQDGSMFRIFVWFT